MSRTLPPSTNHEAIKCQPLGVNTKILLLPPRHDSLFHKRKKRKTSHQPRCQIKIIGIPSKNHDADEIHRRIINQNYWLHNSSKNTLENHLESLCHIECVKANRLDSVKDNVWQKGAAMEIAVAKANQHII